MAAATTRRTPALPKEIFNVDVPNHELLKLAYEAYLANNRSVGAKTLTRGEVRGGGRKPFRQKGTGRARAGSIRSPLWRTGGVIFGPRGVETYAKTLHKNAKRVAIRQALTLASRAGKTVTIPAFECPEAKTKQALGLLKEHGVKELDRTLLVLSTDQKTDQVIRATSNLTGVKVASARYLNVYDILNADKILFSNQALDIIKSWLAPKGKGTSEGVSS